MRRAAPLAALAAASALAGCGGGGPTAPAGLSYQRLPMAFERNAGQAPADVRFVARGPGYALLLGDRAPVLALGDHRLRLGLAGASRAMRVVATGRRIGTVDYLIGRDRSRWRRGIPSYAAARYVGAYPGIDVAFHGDARALEFDFRVAAGADPRRIALAPRGQRALRIDRRGALVLALPGGAVRERAPRSGQLVDGRWRPVRSRFVRRRDGTIGIRLGRYDRARPLTIDPVLTYGTYLGGSTSFDIGYAVAVDASGAAYVAGTTNSVDFPVTPGAYRTAAAGNQDAFVTKVAADGRSFAYSTYFGGSGIDVANDVAVDGTGAAYITGSTTSADLPTLNAFQGVAGGSGDGFVAKLAPSGAALAYSTYLGGSGSDQGTGIAVGPGGAAVVTGQTSSANFPVLGAAQGTFGGGSADAFVTELAASGATLAWSTYLGGAAFDAGARVAVDASGAAYVTGRTQSSAFPTTGGALQTALHGTSDAFAAKLAPAGGPLAWSTLLGGTGTESGDAIAVDDAGAAYVTGATASTDFPATAGAAQAGYGGGTNDAFAAKLAPGGAALAWSTFLGGGASDLGRGIAVDAAHEAFVAGQTASADFPATGDAVQTAYPGGANAGFLTRLAAGGARTFSTFFGGSGGAAALGLALDGAGAAYLTGSTGSTDQPTSAGAAQAANAGATDAFAAKLVPPATITTPTTTTSTTPTTTPTQTTAAPGPPPSLFPGPVRISWNRVAVGYQMLRGVAVLMDVVTPRGRDVTADLRSGPRHGTLRWDRRVAGRVAPPGHYHLVLTATAPDGAQVTKRLGATLRVLYAHTAKIRAGAARIAYDLTEPGAVTLAVARAGGARRVVARAHGRRGHNRIAWNLEIGGRRVAGGRYRLFVSVRTRSGTVARAAVPAP